MASIKQVKVGDTTYDIKATYDSNGDKITDTYVSYTSSSQIVAGTTKNVSKTSPESLYVSNGLIMGGSAQAAGLVTRGVCGVTVPDDNGACSKENLYLNFDGTTSYANGRKVVLGAGSTGTALTGGAYTYCAVRGDEMVSYVSNAISGKADASVIPTKVSQLTNDLGYTTNIGTITGIKMNGVSKGTSGVIDLGTVFSEVGTAAGSNIGSVGTPSVKASTSGGKTTFTFDYLKGEKGDKGDTGAIGSPTYQANNWSLIFS